MAKRTRKKKNNRQTRPSGRRKSRSIILTLLIVGAAGAMGWKWVLPALKSSAVAQVDPPEIHEARVDRAVVQAVQSAREAVLNSRDDADLWGELGMVLLAHDFESQSAICLKQAATLDPMDARWPYLQANSLMLTAPRESIPLLERAVELCGDEPAAPRLTLIELLLEMHELDAAERHLQEYMSHNGEDPRARMSLGRLLFMRQDYNGCARILSPLSRELERQRQLAGRRKSLNLLLAESLRRTGREEEAESVREMATNQSDTQWPDPFMDQVRARRQGLKTTLVKADRLFGKRDYDGSISLLQETVKTYPESLWAKIYLARALIHTGNPKSNYADREARLRRAVELLQEALQDEPESVEALFRLGVATTYRGDHQGAAALYQKAIDLKPDFTMAYYNLAQCKYRLKEPDDAIESLRMAVATEPNFAQGYRMLGTLLLASGRYDEAENALRTALRLTPKNSEIARLHEQAKRKSANADE